MSDYSISIGSSRPSNLAARPAEFTDLSGSDAFYSFLWDCALTHHAKNQDYATLADPFKNFRSGEEIGVPAYKVALLRLLEKVSRLKNIEAKGGDTITDESVDDTLLDIAVLSGIVAIMRKEGR